MWVAALITQCSGLWEDKFMGDQVEIVAAEDAPNDTISGETVDSTPDISEQPVASALDSEAVSTPADEKAEDDAEVETLVDGPVGEVLDHGNAEARAETEADSTSQPAASTAEAVSSSAEEKAEVDVEPLVAGSVGEVLDHGNAEAKAETEVDSTGEPEAPTVESEAISTPADEKAEDDAEVETLVDGPVGEVLDYGNAEARAETEVDTTEAKSSTQSSEESDASKGNVRILAVGQQVHGNVKRIADFGAFVDIGVGRDGLIHISELSVRRVGKVTDVLAEGQEVTAWIKKLDRDRNRISLTLIDPNTKTIRDLNKDDLVQGTVTRILPYGAFVDIGIGRDALLHVREMGVGYVAKPDDVVKVGDTIEARIIELSRRRGRVDLSLKGLRDEPEPTPAPQAEPVQALPQGSNSRRHQESEPEPQEEEDFEDLEVLSPMELAFKRAMEAEGMEMPVSHKKQGKRNRRDRNRSLQDEIVSRTLSSGRK